MGQFKKKDSDRSIKGFKPISLTPSSEKPKTTTRPQSSKPTVRAPQASKPTKPAAQDTTTKNDTTDNDSKGQYIDYETWVMVKFGADYLQLNQQELFDLYVGEVLGYNKVNKDGKVTYEKPGTDEEGNPTTEHLSDNQAAHTQAGIAAGTAGVSSLFNSYLQDGSIDDKDWAKSASASGNAYGSSFAGTGGSTMLSAGDSAFQDYIDDEEVDWEGVGWDAGGSLVTESANKGGGGAGGGAAAGLAFQGIQDKMRANDTDAQTMLGIVGAGIGGAVAGPGGALVGGMAGSAIGADRDRADEFDLALLKDQTKQAIYFEDGQVKINPILTVLHGYSNVDEVDNIVYHQFTDMEEAKQKWQKQKELQAQAAAEWQDAISNYDTLSVREQYLVDQFMSGQLPTLGEGTLAGTVQNDDGTYGMSSQTDPDRKKHNVADMDELAKITPGNIISQQEQSYISTNPEESYEDQEYTEQLKLNDQQEMANYYADKAAKGETLNSKQQQLIDKQNKLNKIKFDRNGYVNYGGNRYTRAQLYTMMNQPGQRGKIFDQIAAEQSGTAPQYTDDGMLLTTARNPQQQYGDQDGLLLPSQQPTVNPALTTQQSPLAVQQAPGGPKLFTEQEWNQQHGASGVAYSAYLQDYQSKYGGQAVNPALTTQQQPAGNTPQPAGNNPADRGLTGTAIIPQNQGGGGMSNHMGKSTGKLDSWLQDNNYYEDEGSVT